MTKLGAISMQVSHAHKHHMAKKQFKMNNCVMVILLLSGLSICTFLYGKLDVAEEQRSPEGYEGQYIDSIYPFLH